MTPLEKSVDGLYDLLGMKLNEQEWIALEKILSGFKEAVVADTVDWVNEGIDQVFIGGIHVPDVMLNKLSVVHPDYTSPHSKYARQMRRVRNHILRLEYKALCRKEEFAISGAMRWEFSQEAPTYLTIDYVSKDTKGVGIS